MLQPQQISYPPETVIHTENQASTLGLTTQQQIPGEYRRDPLPCTTTLRNSGEKVILNKTNVCLLSNKSSSTSQNKILFGGTAAHR